MKKSGVFVAAIIFSIAGFLASAQADDGKKAKALYFAAEQAYTEKKYDEALIGIKSVEALLGSSNALLVGLRVKALYGKGDYEGAKKALDTFFTLDASDDLAREIAPYLARAEKAIEDREKARAAASAAALREAIQKAEAAKRASEAAAAKREADDKAETERLERQAAAAKRAAEKKAKAEKLKREAAAAAAKSEAELKAEALIKAREQRKKRLFRF